MATHIHLTVAKSLFKNCKKGLSAHSNVDDHAYRTRMCNSSNNGNKFPWLLKLSKSLNVTKRKTVLKIAQHTDDNPMASTVALLFQILCCCYCPCQTCPPSFHFRFHFIITRFTKQRQFYMALICTYVPAWLLLLFYSFAFGVNCSPTNQTCIKLS